MGYTVTVTAGIPPSVDLFFDEQPTNEEIIAGLNELAQDMTFEGYVAEYIVTEGGDWTTTVVQT